MTAFLLQLWAIITNGYVQIYFLFFVLVNVFWWTRVYIAHKNKPYTKAFRGTHSVIVPVFRESAEVFEQCLRTIKQYGKPTELIVTIDDGSHASKDIRRIAKKYATKVLAMPERVGKREQYYLAGQALTRDVDVVITVDSDTYWDESTVNILKPFNNKKIGAVSGRQTIFDYQKNTIRRIAEWLEDLRFRVSLPFQSYYGQVTVIPGRTLAIRTNLFKEITHFMRDETFLGRRIITSDDASLTVGVLQRGYQTFYQADSLVHTDAPNSAIRFWRQYLRWYRGSVRRFFYTFGFLVRLHPLVFLSNVEFLFGTFIYGSILATFAFKLSYRLYEIIPVTGLQVTESFSLRFMALIVAGYLVSSYIRNIPHLLHNRRDILFLPVYALFSFITMLPLKLAAFFTFFENGWMTRRKHTEHTQEKNVLVTRCIAVLVGLVVLALTLPLGYVVDIRHIHVPFAVIVRNEAPEYYKARQIITEYASSNPSNDTIRIEHIVDRYAETHRLRLTAQNQRDAAACVHQKLASKDMQTPTTEPLQPFIHCIHQPPRIRTVAAKPSGPQPQSLGAVATEVLSGDTQTEIIRRHIKQLDNKQELSPAQIVFIETTLVRTMGPQNSIRPHQTLTIDLQLLYDTIKQSKTLSASQLAGWQSYASTITY